MLLAAYFYYRYVSAPAIWVGWNSRSIFYTIHLSIVFFAIVATGVLSYIPYLLNALYFVLI